VTRKRMAWVALASAAGLAAALVIAAIVVLQSGWFYEQVRQRILREVEQATGGRVEAGSFAFDWHTLRAELKGFTIHGTEPPGKPPLFHADSVAVGLKIVSIFKRDIDIAYVEAAAPEVYLMVFPDGRTNLPAPRTRKRAGDPMEQVLRLAIGRVRAWNGILQVESRARVPFDLDGRNLAADVLFDARGPRYQGTLAVHPLNLRAAGAAVPADLDAAVSFERNRIALSAATLRTGGSTLQLSGALENLADPHASFRYTAHIASSDVARALRRKLPAAVAEAHGNATWTGGTGYAVEGRWQLAQAATRAEGMLSATPAAVFLSDVRVRTARPVPADTRIARIDLHGRNVDLRAIDASALGGTFRGAARLENFDRFTVKGELAALDARRAVALYSPEALPWDATVSGSLEAEGSLASIVNTSSLRGSGRASVDLTIAPAPLSPPVNGQISATYDARSGAVEIARGILLLPASRAELSGTLGSQLQVHVESRDLHDLAPILGQKTAALPLTLQNGSVAFDGTAAGRLDDLHAAGRLTASHFAYEGRGFDAFSAGVTASPANVQLHDATLSRGAMRVQGQLAVNLQDWKPVDTGLIDGSGTVRNADLAELAVLAGLQPLPATGTASAQGRINGSIGDPLIDAQVSIAKGSFHEEPFDQVTAHVRANSRSIQVVTSQVIAGAKEVRAAARFEHQPQTYESGRLQFEVATNSMPMDQIETISRARPGVKGSVQVVAQGTLDLAPARAGRLGLRIARLEGDVTARGLQLTGQALGNAHLAMKSDAGVLRVHLDSDFADSTVQGNGEWRLEGDYPGTATLVLSRLDFGALRAWLFPSLAGTPTPFNGFAEGQLRIDASLLKPESARAELRIPQFQMSASAQNASLTLNNSGPIVATIADGVLTFASARLVGHGTDLSATGKIALTGRQAVDVRVNGRVDLAIVHSFNRDFVAAGELAADASVRGTLDAPQLTGRVSFQNAEFRVADLPNGISAANGVIGFTSDRATIQSFTGETGGGKVTLTGFAGYGGGPVIFRLHLRTQQVRVRYPEGVSTVSDANLSLTGTSDRSMLSGTITIQRAGFNPQADFSSLMAQSAEPVHTPAGRAGFLGGMSFDVQVQTAPDIQFESSLTEDIQVETNLRLRGTASNPALLGRINITEGRVVFFGTKYTINQGSISFYNPLRIDPVLNIDLDTKARGIDITLTVSGPLNKLTLTPRSDPPLQFNEIVALLATGRTPTNDPAQLAQQATAPQSWQQMGASALLGQAIASPVAGRLQRFFGVSNLRIDPTLPGIEYNPQARLTLEQQITPEITFTYITDVTSSNPQVVRVEWSFAKLWSVVALREENGMFGIDFFYKRRF